MPPYSSKKQLLPIELKRFDARAELLPLRRDLAIRELAYLEKEVSRWRTAVAEHRKRESDRQAREARLQVQNAHPALRSLAEKNAELADQRKSLVATIERTKKEVQRSQQAAQQLKDDLAKMAERVEKAGHSTTIGLLLRRQRNELPDVTACDERLRFVSEETPRIHLSALDLEDDREQLADVDAMVASVIEKLDGDIRASDRPDVTQMVSELLLTRRDVLDKLIVDHDQYIKLLGELELSHKSLLSESDKFVTYIDERVLWIRSSEPISQSDLPKAFAGLQAISVPSEWVALSTAIRRRVAERPWAFSFGLLFVTVLLFFRGKLRSQINRTCEADDVALRYRFLPTVTAVVALAAASAFWPAVLWIVGWQLSSVAMPELAQSCGVGLQSAALTFWLAMLLYQLCRRGGLADSHFNWNADGMSVARRQIQWFAPFGIPVVFFVAAIGVYDDGEWASSLGRIGFLGGCWLLAAFAHSLFRFRGGVFERPCLTNPHAWYCRLKGMIYYLAVGVPLVLAAVGSLGYDYSAQRVMVRLQTSAALVLGVILVRAAVLRWLDVRRQSDSGVDTSASSQLVLASLDTPETVVASDPGAPAPVSEENRLVAAAQTDSQLNYLLRFAVAGMLLVGGHFIWSDITPALGILDHVQLWSKQVDVKETVQDADGIPRVIATQKEVPTTLRHMLLASIILATGWILARNLPALLDVILWERMPLDQGQRYAAGMILRYTVTLVTAICAFRELGFTWSSIQWLAAAMTVGLGFGLQEIFANLVSGLIILFERPVRVGDFVTVGGVDGRVTRMQIRATTITGFDRRELIVPNKKFITEDVMNWTLSDNINRVVIEVGGRVRKRHRDGPRTDVASRSDAPEGARGTSAIRHVRQVRQQLAESHPEVFPPQPGRPAWGDSRAACENRSRIPPSRDRDRISAARFAHPQHRRSASPAGPHPAGRGVVGLCWAWL